MTTAEIVSLHGLVAAPIEAEPLAHFWPGSTVLRVGGEDLDASMVIAAARTCRAASVVVPHLMADSVSTSMAALFDDVRAAGLQWIGVADTCAVHPSSLALLQQCDAVLVRVEPDLRTCRGVISEWVEPLVTESSVWVELQVCLAAGMNDGDGAIHDLTSWVLDHLGADTPVHFSANAERLDGATVPSGSLRRARSIGLGDGLNYVYTEPSTDTLSGTTFCPGCDERVIERRGHLVTAYRLTERGRCHACGTAIAGSFDGGWRGPQVVSLAF